MGELGGERVGHARAHGREVAGQRRGHAAPDLEVAREPVGDAAGVGADDAVVRQARRQFPEHPLRVDRIGVGQGALLDHLPPVLDVLLDLQAPGAVLLALQVRDQGPERLGAVAGKVDLHRVADREHPAVEVDLDAARLALGRQKLGVGEARADHEQGVAAHHHVPARTRAEQADLAGDERQIVRDRGPAEQRLGDAGAQDLGHLDDLVGRLERARADQHRDPLAGVQDVGRAPQVGLGGHDPRRRIADAGVDRAVRARRLLDRVELLDVRRHDDAGDGPLGHRDPQRAVDQMTHLLRRAAHVDVFASHVLEQRDQVDFLLVVAAERRPLLLTHDRDHRLMVELGVVEAVQKMDRARARGRHADAGLAGELGMRAGHEGRDLLMRHLDELEAILRAVEGAQDAVDAIPGIAVDPLRPPRPRGAPA